jgi:hypothetical protein
MRSPSITHRHCTKHTVGVLCPVLSDRVRDSALPRPPGTASTRLSYHTRRSGHSTELYWRRLTKPTGST